ncbi:anti-sigma factor domain-containing protein [Streptomyces bauhiniae]|uniref:anti-sigma factor n=1 Tax=Streptomyces bauhiniae TaxID=2340725 RepID=UPI003652768A
MKHADEETLVLMALGELPAAGEDLHLQSCPACRRELESFRRIVRTAQAPEPDTDVLLQPPAGLWTDIAAELSLEERPVIQEPAVEDELRTIVSGQDGVRSVAESDKAAPAPVPMPRMRRRVRFSVVLAACAALLGAAAGSTVTWRATRGESAPALAAGKPLDSLRAASTGYASLRGTPSHRSLIVEVKGLPSAAGYFEVWLMNRDHTKLVSIGVLNPDGEATLPVPDNIDLGEYSVVDVSVQPYNGKPDHSGKSIVRGPYAG